MNKDLNMFEVPFRPAKKVSRFLVSALVFATAWPAAADPPSVVAGSIVLELHGPAWVTLDANLGCEDIWGDPKTGGGPVASPLDINDMMVIPPNRMVMTNDHGGLVNGHTVVAARVVQLCTRSSQVFQNACGERFSVKTRALPSDDGQIEVFSLTESSGRFSIVMPVELELTLKSLTDGHVLVTTRNLELQGSGDFSRLPAQGGVVLTRPTAIDSNCDGVEESVLPAASDLYLGVRAGAASPFCLKDFGGSLCAQPALVYSSTPTGKTYK